MPVRKMVKWAAAALLVAAAALLLATVELPPRCTRVDGSRGAFSIDIGRLARGQARLFCARDDAGRTIRFILARASDGTVHSVLDACRQCYSYRKGYQVSRNGLVCRLCGNRYSVDHMMAGKASCAPIAVSHQQSGGTVTISAAALRAARGLF
jgi:uncharacterized membrane protein